MKKYQLKNIDCANCAAKIESGVAKLQEVKFVSVNFANSTMTVDTDNIEKVKSRIKELEPEVEVHNLGTNRDLVSKGELEENKIQILKAVSALTLLIIGLIFEKEIHATPYYIAEYAVFITAYLIVGWKVLASAVRNIVRGQVFNEHFLMSVATIGAIALHEMPEAIAVMLFYVVGELFQDIAVNRSRKSIKSLLEIKPDYANVKLNGDVKKVSPEEVLIGDESRANRRRTKG